MALTITVVQEQEKMPYRNPTDMLVTICSHLIERKCWKLKSCSVSIMSFHQNLELLDPLLCQTPWTKSSGRENQDTQPAQGTGVPGSTVLLDWSGWEVQPSPTTPGDTSQLPFSLNCLPAHVLQHRMLQISSQTHYKDQETARNKHHQGVNPTLEQCCWARWL